MHRTLFSAVALLLFGCATQHPGTNPDDMSAAEHRQHAQQEEKVAEAHEAQYDPEAKATTTKHTSSRRGGGDFDYSTEVYNPTEKHLEQAKARREMAAEHEAAARELEQFTEGECGKFPPETRKVCPLLSVVTAENDIPEGAEMTLAPGVPPEAVLDHMRCHHAFGRQEGHKGMPGCPLYLKDIEVALSSDKKSVSITAKDPKTVAEIRRRAAAHVGKK